MAYFDKPDIEVLLVDRNQPAPDTALKSVFDHIKQYKSLHYLTVSSSHFTKTALSQFHSSLSAHGGHLLVEVITNIKKGNLIKQLDRIRDECFNECLYV